MAGMCRVDHIANIVDQETGDAFEEYEFVTVDGRRARLTIARGDSVQLRLFHNRLISKNAKLPKFEGAEWQLLRAVEQRPRRSITWVAKTGWQPERDAYALRSRVIDRRRDRPRSLRPPKRFLHARASFRHGDVDRWVDQVARPSLHSSLASFLLCAGCTAPLLSLVDGTAFGFNIFADSKVGKSLATLPAVSLFGDVRDERDLSNWQATSAALGQACRACNDAVLAINEVGLVKGSRKKAYDVIRPTIFQLTEGREMERHSMSSFAVPEELAKYRLIFISTAEHDIAYYAGEAGLAQDGGELARCIDLPARRGGYTNIVDVMPQSLHENEYDSFSRDMMIQIRRGCARNMHVAPIVEVVKYTMRNEKRAIHIMKREAEIFRDSFDQSTFDEVDKHRAMCFGWVSGGGIIGVGAGILPMREDNVRRIVRHYFEMSRQVRRAPDNRLAAALDIARRGLRSLPREEDYRIVSGRPDGYVRETDGVRQFVVNASRFRSWFANPIDFPIVMKWLEEKDLIVPVRSRDAKWAFSHTLKWPSGDVQRSFCFRDVLAIR